MSHGWKNDLIHVIWHCIRTSYVQPFLSNSTCKSSSSPFLHTFCTFLVLLHTPLGPSRSMLHGWKEVLMFDIRLTACPSIFNRFWDSLARYWSEIATFDTPIAFNVLVRSGPWENRGKCYMDRKRIQCLSKVSQHAPIYLQPFPSNSSLKFKSSPFLRASATLKHVIDIGWTSVRPSVRLSVCPSVRPSVTHWYCIKTAEYIVMISSPHDSPFILVLCTVYIKIFAKFRRGHPRGAAKQWWGIKMWQFSTNNLLYLRNGW